MKVEPWRDEDLYICRICHAKGKLRIQMKDVAKYNGKGRCRDCMSEQHKRRAQLKRASEAPENYRTCNDCDSIYHKFGGGRELLRARVARVRCPKCKSVNIEKFI